MIQSLISRRLCARLLSTLICSIIIVVRPFSRLGGEYAFLALAIKELVFSPDHTLAHQIEKTVLHFFLGGLVGIGFSMFGKYIASLTSPQSALARAIPALSLVLICFIAGYLKSRFRRLTLSARIACFISVWMLTADVGGIQNYLPEAGNFLWITLTAAITGLFSSLLFLHWTCPQFVNDVSSALSALRDGMEMSFAEALSGVSSPHPKWCRINEEVQHNILQNSVELNTTYRRASFQLGLGRVSVKAIKPLLGTVEHLRRELSWGTAPRPFHSESQSETGMAPFIGHTQELATSVVESIKAIQVVALACYQQVFSSSLQAEKISLSTSRSRLLAAAELTRHELKTFCEQLNTTEHHGNGWIGFPQKMFDSCLFTISLLQMANNTRHALDVCEALIKSHETSRPRLWYPRLTADWLGAMPTTVLIEEHEEDVLDHGMQQAEMDEGPLMPMETLKVISENSNVITEISSIKSGSDMYHWIWRLVFYLWNRPQILRIRLSLSRLVRSVNHSSHLRHALKNAAGVALLSIPAFYPPDSSARQWFLSSRGQWLLISYLWVLETNTGATWRMAYLRISGTIIGALYGYIAAIICRSNPYGMVAMMTAAEIPLSWIIINTTFPSMGTVASVTIPSILFSNYFSDSPTSPISLAVLRGVMITGGIVAALLMNSLVFPRHCHVLFLDNVCSSLRMVSQLYMGLSRDLFQRGHTPDIGDKRKTLKLELKIRSSLHLLSALIMTMSDEVSLVPKPMQRYRETLSVLQNLLDLLIGLRKVRLNIPRRETVTAVVSHRRELVSCICMSLFACEQVFGARQPLPQFLPSARQAFKILDLHMEEQIRRSRAASHSTCMGLSLAYAFAELDMLGRLVDTNEELLDLSRKLFGTSAWFHEVDSCMSGMSGQEGQASD